MMSAEDLATQTVDNAKRLNPNACDVTPGNEPRLRLDDVKVESVFVCSFKNDFMPLI